MLLLFFGQAKLPTPDDVELAKVREEAGEVVDETLEVPLVWARHAIAELP